MGNVPCCLPGAGAREESSRAGEEAITGSNPSEATRRSPTSPQADKHADGKARLWIEDRQEPVSPSTTTPALNVQDGRKQIRKGTGMVKPEDTPFEDEDDE